MKQDSGARIAWRFLRCHKARFAAALLWRSLYVIVPMQVPVLTGAIVDGLTHQNISMYGVVFSAADRVRAVQVGVAGLLAVALAYGFTAYAQTMASHKLSRNFVSSLRKTIVEKATQLGISQHQKFGAGDLLDRALTDTASVRRFMERVYIQSVINILRVAYPLAMLLWIDPLLTLFAVSVLPPQLLLSRYFQSRLHTATHKSRRSHSDLTTVVKENLDGVETIKLLSAESASVRHMSLTADRVESDELDASRASAAVSGTVFLMTSLGIALTWWQGSMRVVSGDMTPGSLIIFTGFVAFAYMPFRQYSTVLSTYRRGLVSLERIGELLDVRPSIDERPGAPPLRITEGRIELNNVSFRYAQPLVVQGVDLALEPRQMTAIVGPSGSGKSSLLRLIARLYDPTEGQVCIDGQDTRQVTLASLRASLSMVPQHSVLFSGTVLDNLRIAVPDASDEAIHVACEAAGALEFIEQLERGFRTQLGRGGVSLSGGQAQRLAIARALISRPRIVLMDEPTSALDATSESAVLNTLGKLKRQATVVVVAHRLRTIRQADRVVFMDAGRVVATGTHESLLATAPLYHNLFTAPATNAA